MTDHGAMTGGTSGMDFSNTHHWACGHLMSPLTPPCEHDMPIVTLSERDVERIARRVAELLKAPEAGS